MNAGIPTPLSGEASPPSPSETPPPPADLEACPRCGEPIETIVWGQTNCPRCGLHFECC